MYIQCNFPPKLESIAKIGFVNERLLSLHALYYGIALAHPRALPLEHKTLGEIS
jgi:hypothetical protein